MNKGKRTAPRSGHGSPVVLLLFLLIAGLALLGWWFLSDRTADGETPPAAEEITGPVLSEAPAEGAGPAEERAEGSARPAELPEVEAQEQEQEIIPQAELAPTAAPAATAVPIATAEPSEAPMPASPVVEELLAEMTLREKVCQLMFVRPSAITGVSQVVAAGESTRSALEKYPVGGLFYDKNNLLSREQTAQMLKDVQTCSRIPLLLTCDEEGGRVSRLMSALGTTHVGPMLNYEKEGPEKAGENARTIAGDMKALGFNLDLAPVADVWSNPENTVIGDRAYSTEFQTAAALIPAAVRGFHEGGVACTLKHFPGHGDTRADTHQGSAYVTKTLDQLRAEELLPFRAGIDAGADLVMMGHIIVSEVSPEPAVFEPKLVTELLRNELGFRGVILTDGLEMKALTDHYSSAEIAVRAIQAGVDMLLCPINTDGAVEGLISAVECGEISMERLDSSVRRVLMLKEQRGLLEGMAPAEEKTESLKRG